MSGPPYSYPGGASLTGLQALRLTALDANHLHAWELTETGAPATLVDAGSSASKVNLAVNVSTNVAFGTEGPIGPCPLFGATSANGTGGNGIDCSALVSAFADLPNGAFTLEAWVRVWNEQVNGFIVGASSPAQQNVNLCFSAASQVGFTLRTSGGFQALTANTGTRVTTGAPRYIAGVYDGALTSLYLDGELIAQANLAGTPSWSGGVAPKLCIGKDVPGGSGLGNLYGQASRVRMSNIARSQAYLRSVYQSGLLV